MGGGGQKPCPSGQRPGVRSLEQAIISQDFSQGGMRCGVWSGGRGGAGWDPRYPAEVEERRGTGDPEREGGRKEEVWRMRVLFLMPVYGYPSPQQVRINLLGQEARGKTQLSVPFPPFLPKTMSFQLCFSLPTAVVSDNELQVRLKVTTKALGSLHLPRTSPPAGWLYWACHSTPEMKWSFVLPKPCFPNSLLFGCEILCAKLLQSCPTLLRAYGLYSPPGSSVHDVLQARILEWAAISFCMGSSRSRHPTYVS